MSIVVIKILLTWWFHLFKTDMIWFHMFQCDGSKHAMMVWSGLRCFEGTIFSDRMGYPPKEADNLVGPKLHIYIYCIHMSICTYIYIHTYIHMYIYICMYPVCPFVIAIPLWQTYPFSLFWSACPSGWSYQPHYMAINGIYLLGI